MKITDYSIVDHGLDGEQYFQGCGTAFTAFEHVATGCGDNFADALDDALESMSQGEECNGVDFEAFNARMLADENVNAWPTSPSVPEDSSDYYYYVSIRYSVATDSREVSA